MKPYNCKRLKRTTWHYVYIDEPSVAVLEAAVKQDSQAMRQITKLTKDLALHLFGVSAATLGIYQII